MALSEQQAAEFYDRLVSGKKKNPGTEQVFLRGWNAGIDFALKQLRLTCDEAVDEASEAAE